MVGNSSECQTLMMIASSAPSHVLSLTRLLPVILACTVVLAQSPSQEDYSMTREALLTKYFGICMQDWDVTTHMTKEEWARTCRRVVRDRIEFFLEHGDEVVPRQKNSN
jgi:hypothetical protein